MNKIIKEFNEYKGLLIALGIFFGGYFQVIGLWGVGVEYIRFFSSTQILSDGILGVIVTILIFGIFELGRNNKWLSLTLFITSMAFSFLAFFYHYYSIVIFLSIGTLATFINFGYWIFLKLKATSKIKNLSINIPIGVALGIGIVLILTIFGIASTKIGTTPSSLYLNDKINTEIHSLGAGTKIQYFNDKYIFLVNDSDKIRKVKILKTEEFLIK